MIYLKIILSPGECLCEGFNVQFLKMYIRRMKRTKRKLEETVILRPLTRKSLK